MSRLVALVAGYTFLAIGITGLVLPVLPGWPFIAPGLIILSRHAPWARRVSANELPSAIAQFVAEEDRLPGTSAGPDLPPRSIASRESRRRPPNCESV